MKWGWALSLALTACAAGSAGPGLPDEVPSLPERMRYEVTFSEDLRTLDATLCFDGPTPKALRAGKNEVSGRLRYARWLSPGAVRRLPIERNRVLLGPVRENGCIAYGVDLREGGNLNAIVKRLDSSILASPNAWLLRPDRYEKHVEARLAVKLSEGQALSLPWPEHPQHPGEFLLRAEAFRFDAQAAFGKLRKVAGEHAGVSFEVSVLGSALALTDAEIESWMGGIIATGQHGPGGFPRRHLHVIVVPNGSAQDGVSFGSVTRAGSGSVLLFAGRGTSLASLQRDWVMPHELSHLFLPFLPKLHAWFNEGAATYYQEVLRARAGVLSEHEALNNLAQAMRKAAHEGSGRSLREESAQMYASHSFRAVYWGGAAFFLLADVALRSATNGARSLDSVLAALQRSQAGAADFADVDALLRQLDALAGVEVFVPLASTCLAQPFPDVEPTLRLLGATVEGEAGAETAFGFDADAAPLVQIRRAILSAQPALP